MSKNITLLALCILFLSTTTFCMGGSMESPAPLQAFENVESFDLAFILKLSLWLIAVPCIAWMHARLKIQKKQSIWMEK
jgi:hypothetical protein